MSVVTYKHVIPTSFTRSSGNFTRFYKLGVAEPTGVSLMFCVRLQPKWFIIFFSSIFYLSYKVLVTGRGLDLWGQNVMNFDFSKIIGSESDF